MTQQQLDAWRGAFGVAYTDRNVVPWESRVAGFRGMLAGCEIATVLEIGPNVGHNMLALESLGYRTEGIEPQPYARGLAIEAGLMVEPGSIYGIPTASAAFDLVFTSGVLIHVPPESLDVALEEVVRVSRRYILAIEYFGDEEEIEYRGLAGMLWKRDFAAHYLRIAPLKVLATGPCPEGFAPGDSYVLLEKT